MKLPSPKVVNKRKENYDIYIGRGSIWGNPFEIGKDGNREECIRLYANWIMKQPQLISKLRFLAGKRLGCYCKPKDCHGDVLVELFELLEEHGKNGYN